MKKLILLAALLILFTPPLSAQNFKGKAKKQIIIEQAQKQLCVAEELFYSVQWLGIPAGSIRLKNEKTVNFKGRECYYITARVVPNSFFAAFYDVEYILHTFFDKELLRPLRFEKMRRIRKETNLVTIDFNWEKHEATYSTKGTSRNIFISEQRSLIESTKPVTKQFPENTQDLLSALYYFRLFNIEPKNSCRLEVYYGERVWPIEIRISKLYWRELRGKKTLPLMYVFPHSELGTALTGKRHVDASFTTDSRRIPVECLFSTGIGPIRAILRDLP